MVQQLNIAAIKETLGSPKKKKKKKKNSFEQNQWAFFHASMKKKTNGSNSTAHSKDGIISPADR